METRAENVSSERSNPVPKANSNENASGATTCQPSIHLIPQGKGGVGKSVIASWLAEFLIERGQPVCCIDGDPVNRSLGQYKAFPVEKLELVNSSGILQRSSYDTLVDRFVQQ
jgi:Mrp family chromosome partitioning ATPase